MTNVFVSLRKSASAIIWWPVFGLPIAVWAFVISGFFSFMGLLWDGAWHASFGRDSFFIPPHDMIYGSITLALGMAIAVLVTSSRNFLKSHMPVISPAQASFGIWMSVAAIGLMFLAAIYDDWWHTHIGHIEGDVVLWSPPHFLGLLGGLGGLSGMIVFELSQIAVPMRADRKPFWLWEKLNAPAFALLLSFSFLAFMVAAISLDRYLIYDRLRFDGSVYPILALLLEPALLVLIQRVTNRAGAATFTVSLAFVLVGIVTLILKGFLGYPKVASFPMMGIFSALFLDLTFRRFRHGYRQMLLLGPVFVLIFYATEFLWAWYLIRSPWWPIERTLIMIPIGILVGTMSLLAGAFIASRAEAAGWIQHVAKSGSLA